MRHEFSALWYSRFKSEAVSTTEILASFTTVPELAEILYAEVPKLRYDRDRMHLSRWLTAIEGQIVDTYAGPRQLVHVGHRWQLVSVEAADDPAVRETALDAA